MLQLEVSGMSRRECGEKARKAAAAYYDVTPNDVAIVFLDETHRPGEVPAAEAVVRAVLR